MKLSSLVTGAALGLTMFLGSVATSNAAVIGVTSASAFSADDFIRWCQLGASGTWVNPGTTATSDGGIGATLDTAGTGFQRIDQGTTSWFGNFAPGTPLLWTSGQGPDITIPLDQPVYAVGAQIQANFFGTFIAKIIGSDGGILGSFTETGNSTGANDGSAIFIGLKSTLKDISKIEFVLPGASYMPNDFAIGPISLQSCIPEPSTWGMMIIGFAGIGLAARRRVRRAAAA